VAQRDLRSQVALVTGASRGIGRGVALALAGAGATVYVTGRSTLAETVRLAEGRPGRVLALPCDHRDDEAVGAAFDTVVRELGRLDLLVNNATALPDLSLLFSDQPFWELQAESWDDLMAVGLRSHFVAAQYAARIMIEQRSGLIVNISSAGARTKIGIVPYGVGKAALDHMTGEMAGELRSYGVGVISLWPPPSRTEGMVADAPDESSVAAWSSTEFTGRVIAALAAGDPLARTGEILPVRTLAAELAVEDDANLNVPRSSAQAKSES
jgi:NAD(P)-dependent dehydrogenase (short-subunit alcohol dehydrogenase family)